MPDRKDLKPPLKWAGGKRWLLPHLRPLWQAHSQRRLVEPFCGGLAVALALRPERALLNDVSPHLINFYRWLQRGLEIDMEMVYDEALYYQYRHQFNDLIRRGEEETEEAAAFFYYLNRTGYNGLCRFNLKGGYNVPFGRHKRINYQTDFRIYKPFLQKWALTVGDFESLALEAGDFIYADPPYDVEFRHYSRNRFDWPDQVRLAEWLAQHSGPVVLSNQATPRIVELYEGCGFRLTYLLGPRRISRSGDRTPAKEVLALKNV